MWEGMFCAVFLSLVYYGLIKVNYRNSNKKPHKKPKPEMDQINILEEEIFKKRYFNINILHFILNQDFIIPNHTLYFISNNSFQKIVKHAA